MDDFLTAVKTVKHNGDAKPDSQLKAITTRTTKSNEDRQDETRLIASVPPRTRPRDLPSIERPEEALQLLRSEPDTETLLATLRSLALPTTFNGHFSLSTPGPQQAQIINTLVSKIVPVFWSSLDNDDRNLIVECLSNVAGINGVVTRVKLLVSQAKAGNAKDHATSIRDLLALLSKLLDGDDMVYNIWNGLLHATTDKIKCDLAWKEFSNLIGSGRVVSVVAEAEDVVQDADEKTKPCWLSDGRRYATWLGCAVAQFVQHISNDDARFRQAHAQLTAKALSMGYPVPFVSTLSIRLVKGRARNADAKQSLLTALLSSLQAHTKRQFADHALRWLSSLFLEESSAHTTATEERELQVYTKSSARDASDAAAFLQELVKYDTVLEQHLIKVMTDPSASILLSFAVRRACISVISTVMPDELDSLLERALSTFSDPLFIKHAPILQQECLAQTLLILAGRIHRNTPMALLMTVRSSGHMQGVSNRLEASNTRARWLGMIVGTALSALVDKNGMKMDFGTDDMKTPEARWWINLVQTHDKIGTLEEFLATVKNGEKTKKRHSNKPVKVEQMPVLGGRPTFGPLRPPRVQTEVEGEKVTEILDEETDSDSDEDLKPYAKPDSDPEDSDEDATLVSRNKARPPVYVRDLMAMLRDTENHERFSLGVKHAAGLIRRKTGFGKEVSDHAEELASMLCNLQDPFAMDDFDELRLQALIAVVMSDANIIAPWLSRQTFTGEYSLAQRCTMLTALGIGGRELAGLKDQDELNPRTPSANFPSKQLPPHLHALYSSSHSAKPIPSSSTRHLDSAHSSLEKSLITPLALHAADQSTAHLSALKVRTFSSRLSTANRTIRKPTANNLAKIFAKAFFFPLINRYQQEIAAYGSSSVWSSAPFLLVTLLKTLALLYHASGPATIGLRDVTTEFWNLLLSLRVQALGDITVLEAVLFGFLTILEVLSGDKKVVAQEFGKELMETREWVDMVFERTGASGLVQDESTGEEGKVRTLAAGVLVRAGEVVEQYQREFMGMVSGM